MLTLEIREKLKDIQQEHILKFWEALLPSQKQQLIAQIQTLDIQLFRQQQMHIINMKPAAPIQLAPILNYSHSGDKNDAAKGLKLLAEGKCGCLLVAGGQGTRLRFEGPKGMCPVTMVKHKTLYQLFAEKIEAASKQVQHHLPLAIMTSPATHLPTVNFFEKNQFFNLRREQLSFFSQKSFPLLDDEANLFLEEKGCIAEGPDGNGLSLKYFVDSGLWDSWYSKGIRYLNYIVIDNPLADPFDAELFGFHDHKQADVTVKSIRRTDPNEKLGVLGQHNGRPYVIEYSELSDEDKRVRRSEEELKFGLANISLFCFTMDFVKEASNKENYESMPWHLAYKAVKYVDSAGDYVQASKPNAWKFEKFIFDLLPFSSKVHILNYPREYCFAPLKNFSGSDSLPEVQKALQRLDKIKLEGITGCPSPDTPFELSQDFYYPTEELLLNWKNLVYT
jgi:UDP-N-acetylglucosamine/UDP-N-acetylgalactosamine diphosphorylase